MDSLKADVFSLIQEHEDITALLNENDQHDLFGAYHQISVQSSLNILKRKKTTGISGDVALANEISQNLHSIIKCSLDNVKNRYELLSSDQVTKLDTLICVVKELILLNQCDVAIFRRNLCNGHLLPFELLRLLHNHNVVSYAEYLIMNASNTQTIQSFTKSLVFSCLQPSDDVNPVNAEIISVLISHSCSKSDTHGQLEQKMKKIADIILNTISRKLVASLSLPNIENMPNTDVFEKIISRSLIQKEDIKNFMSKHLVVMVTHNATIKVTQAICDQNNWSFTSAPANVVDTYRQLLLAFDDQSEALSLLKQTLQSKEVNWKMVLSFVSTLLVCYSQAIPDMTQLISSYITQAIDQSDTEKMLTGFLLARQVCSEGLHVFCSYSSWFQDNFQGPNCVINSRKNFVFFIKFLTDILPHEPSKFIKVHIKCQPFVVASCRPLWQDYVVLAKSKLDQMSSGAGHDLDSDQSAIELAKAETMLADALVTYGNSNKLPIAIMEMSIFRKPFFLARFLPVLLRPRVLPHPEDTKMKFIADLDAAGKIPVNMMNVYKEKCEKET